MPHPTVIRNIGSESSASTLSVPEARNLARMSGGAGGGVEVAVVVNSVLSKATLITRLRAIADDLEAGTLTTPLD